MFRFIRRGSILLFVSAFLMLGFHSTRALGQRISDEDVWEANNADTLANGQYSGALHKVNLLVSALESSYDAPQQYAKFKADLNGALAASDAAQKKVTAALGARDDYKSAVAASDAAEQAVNDARDAQEAGIDDNDNDSNQIFKLAQDALTARTAVSKIVTAALNSDADYQAARAHILAATSSRKSLDDVLAAAEMNDPAIQAARKAAADMKSVADAAHQRAADLYARKQQQDLADSAAAAEAALADQNDLNTTNHEGIFPTPYGRIVNFSLPIPRERVRDDHDDDKKRDDHQEKDKH